MHVTSGSSSGGVADGGEATRPSSHVVPLRWRPPMKRKRWALSDVASDGAAAGRVAHDASSASTSRGRRMASEETRERARRSAVDDAAELGPRST